MNWSTFFFRRARYKNKLNIYEFHSMHLRTPLHLWLLPRKATDDNIRSFTVQGPVAEWLRPQVRIARNDQASTSLRWVRNLPELLFSFPLQPEISTWICQWMFFVVPDVKTNSTATNSTVLHLRTPHLLPRKVTHENIRSFTMQGTVAEWLRWQVRVARNDYLKWSLETVKHLLLSEVGSKPAIVAFLFTLQLRIDHVIFRCTRYKTQLNIYELHCPAPSNTITPLIITQESDSWEYTFFYSARTGGWMARVTGANHSKRLLETIAWNDQASTSLGGGFETCQSCFFHSLASQEPWHELVNEHFSLY